MEARALLLLAAARLAALAAATGTGQEAMLQMVGRMLPEELRGPAEQAALLQMPRDAREAVGAPLLELDWATSGPQLVANTGPPHVANLTLDDFWRHGAADEAASGREERLPEADTSAEKREARPASAMQPRQSNGAYDDTMPTGKEWDHFVLVRDLRKSGFTCPDGTVFPPNNEAFEWDCRLFRAARHWADRMATENFVAHQRGGSTACKRTEAQGFPQMRGCGENIAAGAGTPDGAMAQLKKSNSHCKNMMAPGFNKLGVGYAFSRHSAYSHHWVDSFGSWHYGPDKECIGGEPAPNTKPGCEDIDTFNCRFYRDQGYCNLSPSVQSQCKDTCGIGHCGSSPKTPADACKDVDHHCEFYKGLGFCGSVENVRAVCMRTCGVCGVPPTPRPMPRPVPRPSPTGCADFDGACGFYHRRGYCRTSDHIRKQCMQSCGICAHPAPPPLPPRRPICRDTPQTHCKVYWALGYCMWVPNVKNYCKQTCGLC